jgi:hypothetical protein
LQLQASVRVQPAARSVAGARPFHSLSRPSSAREQLLHSPRPADSSLGRAVGEGVEEHLASPRLALLLCAWRSST